MGSCTILLKLTIIIRKFCQIKFCNNKTYFEDTASPCSQILVMTYQWNLNLFENKFSLKWKYLDNDSFCLFHLPYVSNYCFCSIKLDKEKLFLYYVSENHLWKLYFQLHTKRNQYFIDAHASQFYTGKGSGKTWMRESIYGGNSAWFNNFFFSSLLPERFCYY